MVMGTASTMNSMAEALGMSLPGCAAIPAVDSRRRVISQLSGRRIVEMVKEDLRISKILKRENFLNAVRANGALGGSTNAVIHLLAIAGRLEVEFTLDDWQRYGHDVPTLVDLMPSGRFLMEDYYYAGGLPAVMRTLGENGLLDKDALTVTGSSIWDNVEAAPNTNTEVIRTFDNPHTERGGIVILRGNLAPDGAVLKPSAGCPYRLGGGRSHSRRIYSCDGKTRSGNRVRRHPFRWH
jgi:dihydroxyacid dehydratase/phosphogluconate dehydratase